MNKHYRDNPVLAIYPFTRGFAFILFEGPENPYDWGVKEIKSKHRNAESLVEIKKLIDRYRPEAMIIEDTSEKSSRRSARIRNLYRSLIRVAEKEYVEIYRYSNIDVRKFFCAAGAKTKYEIAHEIAKLLPYFAHRIPRLRKAWMAEDPRQSLFDAAALGLIFYQSIGALSLPDSS